MNPKLYGVVSGIVVHQCRTCGAWLNGENAAKFFLLFEAGRLPELAERASRAVVEDLEARVTKLERQASVPSVAPTLDRDCPTPINRTAQRVYDLFAFLDSLF